MTHIEDVSTTPRVAPSHVGDLPPWGLADTLKVYELYLADLGRIGTRQESARQYYVTIISAIIAFLALAGKDGFLSVMATSVRYLCGLFGCAIGILWFVHMSSFANLYDAKFCQLKNIEQTFQYRPFTDERSKRRNALRLSTIDRWAAVVVIVASAILAAGAYGP